MSTQTKNNGATVSNPPTARAGIEAGMTGMRISGSGTVRMLSTRKSCTFICYFVIDYGCLSFTA